MEATEEIWDKTIDVNLKGMFNMCKFVIPQILKEGKGKIVNVSSLAGRKEYTLGIPYAASKAGVVGLKQAFLAEFTSKGILINELHQDQFTLT
ncbi:MULTISPECIES: SDR family NAD(P)-dependent oxidoreductase [Caldisericum]|uniref:SDR family NAD(P)-dependent oxidoreductase n=1 Tax=Caldisericum TaxID=693074 RepID=UPI003C755ECE